MGMYRGKRACRFMSMWQKESGNFDPKDSTIVMAEILKETPGAPPPPVQDAGPGLLLLRVMST